MTVLTMIQEHCRRSKLPVPGAAASSNDPQAAQLFALMNELLEDLVTRKLWQQNTRETVHTSLAQEDQGNITTLSPGFVEIVRDSFYNRTTNLRIHYGLQPPEWQLRKITGAATGSSYWARLRENKLLFSPAPPAGQTIAWEYRSEYFVKDADTQALKELFTKDGDTFILPERIGRLWLRWRWKHEKGLDYAQEFAFYESQIELFSQRDNGPRVADMGRTDPDIVTPGIVIPEGNWDL